VGRHYGKHSGIVAKVADAKFRGEIDVTVPSIFGPTTVVRARPCLPPGHFYVPDVDARVWVEFEGGDTRFPIWVGTWYPNDAAPPEAKVDPPTHRVIHTKAGHIVELSDEADKEKIVIRHKTNAFFAVQPDGSIVISNQKGSNLFLNADGEEVTLMSQHGHLVTMTDKGLMLVNDGGSVVELKGDTASLLAKNIVVSGTSVALGANANSPTIMGTAFKALWTALMTHVHPSAMGPTGPPTPPILPLIDGVHLTSSVVVK
jgi:hypothetical protein